MVAENNEGDKTRSFIVLAPGTKIDHYEIVGSAGAGGMGEVFIAQDTNLNRKLVLKFLPPHLASDEAFKERFIREAQSAAALNHENIITVFDFSKFEDRLYIAMEYLQGKSLKEILSEGILSVEYAIKIISQICSGLKAAHDLGIIHRDIKPDNVIVNDSGHAKILDFGLAKADDDPQLTRAGTVMGTASYMSPEQCQGIEADNRSDIFSVGVVLYEMVTGHSPFKRANVPAMLQAVVNETPDPVTKFNNTAPEAIQNIIDKAIAKDPAVRYQKIDEMLSDLQALQSTTIAPTFITQAHTRSMVGARAKSLAVLYLKNLGSDDDEFLSYGITEDLIVDLTRVGSLRIVPMRKILKFKNSDADLEEIAEKLQVEMILDGSIHRSNGSIRVSAELINVATDENLWADRWEESYDNLPRIKQSLASGIIQAFDVSTRVIDINQVGHPEAQDSQAYEFYLRGKYAFETKKDSSDVEVALGLFNQAFKLESSLIAARIGIAEIHIYKGKWDLANRELKEILEEARTKHQKADQAVIYKLLAKSNEKQSNWDEAKRFSNQALDISRETGDLDGEAAALASLIVIAQRRSQFDEALKMFKRVLEINRLQDDEHQALDAQKNIGVVLARKGENKKALEIFQNLLEIAKKNKNVALQGSCIGSIGNMHYLMGNPDDALENYRKSLKIYNSLGDLPGQAREYNNMAMIYESKGEYKKAIEIYEKSSAIKLELGDKGDHAISQNNMAVSLTYSGEYERSIATSRETLKVATELDFPLIITESNQNLGMAYLYCKQPQLAKEYFEEALKVSVESNLKREVAESFCFLAELHYYDEEFDQCRENAQRAIDVAEDINDKENLLKAQAYHAFCLTSQGKVEEGIKKLRQAYAEARNHGIPLLVLNAKRLLGQALINFSKDLKSEEEGKAILEDALSLAQEKEIAYEVKAITAILDETI